MRPFLYESQNKVHVNTLHTMYILNLFYRLFIYIRAKNREKKKIQQLGYTHSIAIYYVSCIKWLNKMLNIYKF